MRFIGKGEAVLDKMAGWDVSDLGVGLGGDNADMEGQRGHCHRLEGVEQYSVMNSGWKELG